jgi:hypothetical protein
MEDPRTGARVLRWLQAFDLELPFDELRALASLEDPAGPIDFGEVELASRGSVAGVLATSMRSFEAWEQVARRCYDGSCAPPETSGASVGPLGAELTFEPARLWRRLVERGLAPADVRRQFLRILLKAQGTPERLVRSDDGRWLVEVRDVVGRGWARVDPDQPPPEGPATFELTMTLR